MNTENEGLQKFSTLRNIKRTLKNYQKYLSDATRETSESIVNRFAYTQNKSKDDIAEYRKKIKIYDVFNFFNEFDVLEIRLNILNEHVDYFVIVESTMTHSGKPKELLFKKNKDRYKQFEHKIIHYVIDNPIIDRSDAEMRSKNPQTSPFEQVLLEHVRLMTQHGVETFIRDSYEKEYVKKPLLDHGIKDEDFCFISDLDEIWNPEAFIDYSLDDVFKVKQIPYVYYLNNRSNENWRGWTGTIGTKFKNLRNSSLNQMRTMSLGKYHIIKNGGWHFTFQGGADSVKQKIESYSHQELNNKVVKTNIKNIMSKNKDIMGRYYKFWVEEKNLPKYLLENKEKYKHLFR